MNEQFLKEAYNKIARINGHPDNLYVQRPKEYLISESIYTELLLDLRIRQQRYGSPPKYFLVGLRGSGKTTELQNLRRLLDYDSESPWLTIFVSIEDYFNPMSFDFPEIPLAFTSALAEHLVSLDMEAAIDKELIDRVINWVETNIEIKNEVKNEWRVEPSNIILLGKLLKYIGLDYKYSRIRTNLELEKPRKPAYELIDIFNELISHLEEKTGKCVIFVVDNADKLSADTWDSILRYFGKELAEMMGVTIWGFSPHLVELESYQICKAEFGFHEFLMEAIPLYDRSAEMISHNCDFYRDIVYLRISEEILPKSQFLTLCYYAQGNIRTLLIILRDCLIRLTPNEEVITDDRIKKAMQHADMPPVRLLTASEIEQLARIHLAGQLISSSDTKFFYFGYLIRFCYREDIWLSVHPAIQNLNSFRMALEKLSKETSSSNNS